MEERSFLNRLLQESEAHSREKLLSATLACYSGISYGDANWGKVPGGSTTPAVPTIYGQFKVQFPELTQLSLDPGFVTHLPEAMKFLKERGSNGGDYQSFRDELKQHLGKRTVWRGMVLTEGEVEKITTGGIESKFLQKEEGCYSRIEQFEANILSTYFNELVEVHTTNEKEVSPLVSVSLHKDVAIAVGRHFGTRSRRFSDKPGELYLFKLSIPEIDLIYHTDHGFKRPPFMQFLLERASCLHITVNKRKAVYSWGKEVESFILHKINPEEIIEVSKPTVRKSSWNGQFTE